MYPFTAYTVENLGPTRLVSPRPGNHHGIALPHHDVFVSQLEEVKEVTAMTRKGQWATKFFEKYIGADGAKPSPILMKYIGISENSPMKFVNWLATDHPMDYYDKCVEPWARAQKIKLKHQGPGMPFLDTVGCRAQAHAMIHKALDAAFDVKYYYGKLRPCELYDTSICILDTPNHPTFVGGHATFGQATAIAFSKLWDATPEQVRMVEVGGRQIGHGRTLGGVHFAADNESGFDVAIKILK
jgi:hypothetical protein